MKKLVKILLISILCLGLFAGGVYAFFSFQDRNDPGMVIPKMEGEKVKLNDKHYYTTPDTDQITIDEKTGIAYVNDQILIYANNGTTFEQMETFAKEHDLKIVGYIEVVDLYQMESRDELSYKKLNDLIASIKEDMRIQDAMINSVFEQVSDAIPNDPWNSNFSWDMEHITAVNNWGLLAIKAPTAWEHLSEMANLNLGIIDLGVDKDHEDLDVKINVNASGSNKIYGDERSRSHGTHVAGTMGAKYDNNLGISGVFPKATIYSYATGRALTDMEYVSAISLLVTEYNCKVINTSMNSNRLIGFAADHGNKKAINVLTSSAKAAGQGLRKLLDKKYDFVICVAAGNNNTLEYYEDSFALYGYKEFDSWWDHLWHKELSGGTTGFYNNLLNAITDDVVRSHIICVGSVGLSGDDTLFTYSSFANSGERVDVAAPGEYIYSTIPENKYDTKSGTSMATPHVSGVAALIYSLNPKLNGAEVKKIITGTTYGRYYMHDSNYVGLVQADAAVEAAIKSIDEPLNRVITNTTGCGLDLCFVIDTTGSMGDEINDVKENMSQILTQISEKTDDYRVAIVDYRDFSSRTKHDQDYPSKVQLDFSSNFDTIQAGINSLSLGHGGDDNETVYSGIMEAIHLPWRTSARKMIILMGDAAPLDPEPNTKYTYAYIASALYSAGISVGGDMDIDAPDTSIDYTNIDLGLGDASDSLMSVYSINVGGGTTVQKFFEAIAEVTGGMFSRVEDAQEVSTAIIDSIEHIELEPVHNVRFTLDEKYESELIYLYTDEDEFMFAFPLNEDGKAVINNLKAGKYHWESSFSRGSMKVAEDSSKAKITILKERFHLAPKMQRLLIFIGAGAAIVLLLVLTITLKIRKALKARKKTVENQ